MSTQDKLAEALRDVIDCMWRRGVSTDPNHPDHVAIYAADAALQAHAAETAQAQLLAAEPVYQWRHGPMADQQYWKDCSNKEDWEHKRNSLPDAVFRILYTHPQPAQDAKDAARYRWLRDSADSYTWDYLGGIGADRVDAAVDAAMAKESGR